MKTQESYRPSLGRYPSSGWGVPQSWSRDMGPEVGKGPGTTDWDTPPRKSIGPEAGKGPANRDQGTPPQVWTDNQTEIIT